MIFYEAPHRLLDTLEELEKIFGSDREMAAIREPVSYTHLDVYKRQPWDLRRAWQIW